MIDVINYYLQLAKALFRRRFLNTRLLSLFCGILLSLFAVPESNAASIKIACIGDSVTYGLHVDDRETNSYPAQLEKLLGAGYDVKNFGVSGATLLRNGHHPYSSTEAFKSAIKFDPDVVVIDLGLNDTDPRDWPDHRDEFRADYSWLIEQFHKANPDVRIYISILTPIFESHPRFKSSTRDWAEEIRDIIPVIAKANHTELIDLHTPLFARPDLFPDAIHPNTEGASILALTVYQAITGNHGGLKLTEGYGDHMVLPHGEILHLTGEADRNEVVTLQFDQLTFHTRADMNGRWTVALPAQRPGGPYTLRFSTATKSVQLQDIYFGELWLCSGQSNMDFPVSRSAEASLAQAMINQPTIRLLHYKNAASTDPIWWSQEVLDKTNQLHFFSGQWETLNSANVNDFSAVGYFFAQRLHQKLNIPIGIIQVSVGGSNAESWIDRKTLEDNPRLVDMFIDWRDSDLIMPWCRERAAKNLANAHNPLQRHPYEPAYNFEAGIAPLLQLPIRGVIWYQGESNTHNVELYEHLFPVLVKSWRKQWKRDLPFFYVQLSELNRPSWPVFRDAQRRLADVTLNSAMVVSSDLGEPDQVHYVHKKAVGDRLANLALEKVYHLPGVHGESPLGFKVSKEVTGLKIEFKNTGGKLRTSDGLGLRGFELQDAKGNWHTAQARIEGNHVLLERADVRDADAVAYAWQPFPNANLINGYGLPASTFILDVP
ncbi:MAG TPA: GDSL-type esterase/lipase family protein [Acidisarcina sp.]|nr:GDSL-type esterase/lipase family protein [Acidisarcina sp.]